MHREDCSRVGLTCGALQHAPSHQTHDLSNQPVRDSGAIDREAARAPPPSHRGSARVPTPRPRPPRIRAALPSPPGGPPSPPRLRQRPQKSPRGRCQTARNRSTPMCERRASPTPPPAGSFAPELARAPAPAAQPPDTAELAVGRCSSRSPAGSCSRSSSRMSTRSMKLCMRNRGPPTMPSAVRYQSTMGTMLQSCFCNRFDGQPSTSRSVQRTRQQTSR